MAIPFRKKRTIFRVALFILGLKESETHTHTHTHGDKCHHAHDDPLCPHPPPVKNGIRIVPLSIRRFAIDTPPPSSFVEAPFHALMDEIQSELTRENERRLILKKKKHCSSRHEYLHIVYTTIDR